jgi:hypothetical protein
MTTASAAVPDGYLKDAKGHLVPLDRVRPVDTLEDQLVRDLMGHAGELSGQIARFKAHCFDDVGAFLSLLAERYGAKRGGAKGNMTFTAYDGRLKVQIAVADRLVFGPELQVAKALIDECIVEWAAGVNANIRALVEHAFRTDQEGKVSREAVFALRRIEIDDERWRSAMAAIADSIRVESTKTYIRFYRRDDPAKPWQAVTIDLASA